MNPSREPYARVPALVLGGSGFIGSWVARSLAEAGAELTVAARDAARTANALARHGIRAQVLPCPFDQKSDVEALLDRATPAIIFNLIGYGVDRAQRDPAEMMRINCELVRWLAEAAAERQGNEWSGARLIHAGSALEYGDVGGELDERVTCNPTVPYGRSKLAGTAALREVALRTGLRAMTARLFTVYGPGEHQGRLLPTLIRAAETGERVTLSSGTQRRDFTWVGDVASGMLRLGQSDAASGSVVNLATGIISTVRKFSEIAAEVLDIQPSQLAFGEMPTRPDEMLHSRVSVDRMREITGWTPRTTIHDGVRLTREFQLAMPHAAARN